MKVVAIKDVEKINNILHLPYKLCKIKYRLQHDVLIHHQPIEIFDGVSLTMNYDVVIDSSIWEDTFLDESVVLKLKRFDKLTQQVRLFQATRGLGLTDYICRRCSNTRDVDRVVLPPKSIILKPLYGARSLSMVKIEAERSQQLDVAIAVIAVFKEYEPEDINKGLELVANKYRCRISLRPCNEHFSGESLNKLSKSQFYMDEFIPDIEEEYRLLVNAKNELVYIQRRNIEEIDGDTLVSGVSCGSILQVDELPPKVAEELLKLIATGVLANNSCDLFITREKKWGIFEYQPQFGTSGIPREISIEYHLDIIRQALSLLDNSGPTR